MGNLVYHEPNAGGAWRTDGTTRTTVGLKRASNAIVIVDGKKHRMQIARSKTMAINKSLNV